MSWIKIQSFVLVVLAFLLSILLFLAMDFFLGHKFVTPTRILSEAEKPYLRLDRGWYELRKNFIGSDQFGPLIYSVETDEYGFRKAPGTSSYQKHNVIFLGDSFTYGINSPWNETFVGMFVSRTGANVLNAGVSSYSPTPYLYQYRKALKNNILTDQHVVIIGIDISDVQDEAGYWVWDEMVEAYPRKMQSSQEYEPVQIAHNDLRTMIRDSFPLTTTIYRYLRYAISALHHTDLVDLPRSAFTWGEWSILDKTTPYELPAGYAPLGVRGGLQKVAERLSQIVKLASKNQSKVYFLIYPWPAQVVYSDKFDWSGWVRDLCAKENCAGVIDTIPSFRALATQNKDWLSYYYLTDDTHFNERGNRVISEHLFKSVLLH